MKKQTFAVLCHVSALPAVDAIDLIAIGMVETPRLGDSIDGSDFLMPR